MEQGARRRELETERSE
jgi:hypothetical protein